MLALYVPDAFGGEFSLVLLMLLVLPLWMDSLRISFGEEQNISFSCQAYSFAFFVRDGDTTDVLSFITWLLSRFDAAFVALICSSYHHPLCWQKNDCVSKQTVVLSSWGVFLPFFVPSGSCCSEQEGFCPDSKCESYLLWAIWWQRRWRWYFCYFVPSFWGLYYFPFLGFSLLCNPEYLVSMNVLISSSKWALIAFCMSPTIMSIILSEFINHGVVILMCKHHDDVIVKCSQVGFSHAPYCCAVHWCGKYIYYLQRYCVSTKLCSRFLSEFCFWYS